MTTDNPRFSVAVTPEVMEQIIDYRFDHRFNSRSAAAADLIEKGLQAVKDQQKKSHKE